MGAANWGQTPGEPQAHTFCRDSSQPAPGRVGRVGQQECRTGQAEVVGEELRAPGSGALADTHLPLPTVLEALAASSCSAPTRPHPSRAPGMGVGCHGDKVGDAFLGKPQGDSPAIPHAGRLSMQTCTLMHTRACTYTHTYTHTGACTHTHAHTGLYIYTCTHRPTHTDLHIHTQACIHVPMHTDYSYKHTLAHTHRNTQDYTPTLTHTCAHTDLYIYTQTSQGASPVIPHAGRLTGLH